MDSETRPDLLMQHTEITTTKERETPQRLAVIPVAIEYVFLKHFQSFLYTWPVCCMQILS